MKNPVTNALKGAGLVALAASLPAVASAADLDILKVSGYIRQGIQFNLSDPRETPENDRFALNMSRTTVRFDLEAELPTVTFVAIARASREIETNYLKRLNRLKDINFNAFTGAGVPGNNASLIADGSLDLEEYLNKTELREMYAEFDVTDRITARLGKQQVAFGETDFFQANDLLHGFDFTWRSFLEAENEELRRPLTMANFTIQVPELDGKLQLIYGPGDLNPKGAFGTQLDIFGGRFAGQPNKGFSFLDTAISPYNYGHRDGNTSEDFWAARWSGFSYDVNYSLMYMRHFNPDPIVLGNPNTLPNLGSSAFSIRSAGLGNFLDPTGAAINATRNFMLTSEIPFEGSTCTQGVGNGNVMLSVLLAAGGPAGLNAAGALPFVGGANCYAEVVYPIVNTFGGTASYYDAFTDAVYSAEVAYTVDKPFQSGRFCNFCEDISGFVGLARAVRRDQASFMLRADKLLYLSDYIGTHRASFLSIQAFNKWIPNFEKSDELVVGPGFGQPKKRWETVVTAILAMNYLNDRINPVLAAGVDATYGGWFLIPSVTLVQGDSWRLLVEGDFFFANDDRKPTRGLADGGLSDPFGGGGGSETARNEQEDNIFGSFNSNNQLYIRLTRQF